MSDNTPRRVKIGALTDHLDRKKPFEVELSDGTVFRLRDPKALQLREQLRLGEADSTEEVLQMLLGDDWDAFASRPEVDGYFFEALMAEYDEHFDIDRPGSPASSTS